MREGGTYDDSLSLRDSGQSAITTTTAETGIALKGAAIGDFKAVVNIEAIDNTTTDETYLVTVEACTSLGGSYEVVGTILSADLKAAVVLGGGTAKMEVPLSGKKLEDTFPGVTHVRINATLGGTSPSLTYNAYLARC